MLTSELRSTVVLSVRQKEKKRKTSELRVASVPVWFRLFCSITLKRYIGQKSLVCSMLHFVFHPEEHFNCYFSFLLHITGSFRVKTLTKNAVKCQLNYFL